MYYENYIDVSDPNNLLKEFVNSNQYIPYDKTYYLETNVYLRKGKINNSNTLLNSRKNNYIKSGVAPMRNSQPVA